MDNLGDIVGFGTGVNCEHGVRFYSFLHANSEDGAVNVPYVSDLPSVQMEHNGEPRQRCKYVRDFWTERAKSIDGFITISATFAEHIKQVYEIDVPYGLFPMYPTEHVNASAKRREIAYIDNQSMMPVGFEKHVAFLDRVSRATGLECVFPSRRFSPWATMIIKRRRRCRVRSLPVARYDHMSKFGILVNQGFNQAHEAINRKLLTYLASCMVPIVHASFTEAIKYLRSHRVGFVEYETPDDIARELAQRPRMNSTRWDSEYFTMASRTPDLVEELTRVGGMLA